MATAYAPKSMRGPALFERLNRSSLRVENGRFTLCLEPDFPGTNASAGRRRKMPRTHAGRDQPPMAPAAASATASARRGPGDLSYRPTKRHDTCSSSLSWSGAKCLSTGAGTILNVRQHPPVACGQAWSVCIQARGIRVRRRFSRRTRGRIEGTPSLEALTGTKQVYAFTHLGLESQVRRFHRAAG